MEDIYEKISQNELLKLQSYKEIYEATHPFPKKIKVSFLRELGIESGMLVLSAVSAIVLSAIRTSTIFMLTEALLIAAFDKDNLIPETITNGFPLVSMIVSLTAFEGYLAAHGYTKGKESSKISINSVAVWLCFGVTIMAGLSASFGLLGLDENNAVFLGVSWILAGITAIGAPVVSYYGALNLGVIGNKWNKLNQDSDDSFKDSVDSWNKAFISSFSGKRSQKLFSENVQRTNDAEESFSSSFSTSSNDTKSEERREQIISILESTTNGNEVLGTSEISKILAGVVNNNPDNISGYEKYKGYVHKVRKEWKLAKGLENEE